MVRRPLAALANPNYRLYVFGQIVSQSGAWMQRIAQAWLVLDLTDSPVALGTLAALQFLPILVFSLFAGVVVDRLPKRRFLMALQLGAVTQATLLAVLTLTGTVQLWEIYALGLLLGAITAFDNPTRQTFVSEMVDREQLQSAVAINASVFNFGRIAGPAIGGVIVATGGAGWCFAVNAVSYFAVLGALALMRADRLHPVAPRAHATVATELLDGLRYVRSERRLTIPLVVQAFMGVFGWNFSVILPLLARYAFDVGPVGFGTLNAAQGFGAVVGSVVAAGAGRPRTRTLVRTAAVFGIVLAAIGLAPVFGVAVVLLVLLGGVSVFFQATTNTSLQLTAQEEYRGRVMSVYLLLSAGATPIGSPFTGALADILGIRAAVMVNGALVLVGAGTGWLLSRRGRVAR